MMLLTWKLRPREGTGQPKVIALDVVEPGGNVCCLPQESFVLVLSCLSRVEASELFEGLYPCFSPVIPS